MKLIQTVNTTPTVVPAGTAIPLGKIDRRVCARNNFGVPTFNNTGDSITLNWLGYYKVDANIVFNTGGASTAIIALVVNGTQAPGAITKDTFLGGDVKSVNISKILKVERGCCRFPGEPLTLQLINLGEDEFKVDSINFSVIKVD